MYGRRLRLVVLVGETYFTLCTSWLEGYGNEVNGISFVDNITYSLHKKR
jgi:hypothetical protein